MGKKRPKISAIPRVTKKPRSTPDIYTLGQQTFKWRVNSNYVDLDDAEWGWGKVTIEQFFKILMTRLHEYEEMTWDDLLRRPHCHAKDVARIENRRAQVRICEKCPDIDTLYQIDIESLCRVWGYRDRQIFYLIWHDPNHTVSPTKPI